MQIRWSPEAADDLERIVRQIQQDKPAAAREVAGIIYQGISSLKNSPLRGRVGRIEGSRELVFAPLPYIAVYRVKEDIVEVSRIYHGAQDWP
jgi:addiction module RelE/StbE family toxin